MKFRKDCKLECIKEGKNSRGGVFIIKDNETDETLHVSFDESVNRVKARIMEQNEHKDERNGIYLSLGMLNINVNTEEEDCWSIYDEKSFCYYNIPKKDFLNIIK